MIPRGGGGRVPVSEETDDGLSLRIINDSEKALERLASRHLDRLRSCALAILGDEALAEASAWEAIEWVWEHRAQHPWKHIGPYLLRKARSIALNQLRSDRARRRREARWTAQFPRQVVAPDRLLELGRLGAEIESLMRQLPRRQQEVLILVTVSGFSHKEAGRVLGISHRTVEHHLETAHGTLRARLHSPVMDRFGWARGSQRVDAGR